MVLAGRSGRDEVDESSVACGAMSKMSNQEIFWACVEDKLDGKASAVMTLKLTDNIIDIC